MIGLRRASLLRTPIFSLKNLSTSTPLRQDSKGDKKNIPGKYSGFRIQPVPDQVPKGYSQLKITQQKFQVQDGKPIFLKRGRFDKYLYQTTFALAIVGLAFNFVLFYSLMFPKPEN